MSKSNVMRVLEVTAVLSLLLLIYTFSKTAFAPSQPLPIRIGYLDFTPTIPFYVARSLNLFSEKGLQIDAQKFTTANDLANAVSSGQVDVAVEIALPVAFQVWEISPNTFRVFAVDYATPTQHQDNIFVLNNSTLQTVSDLKGKKIGVFPGAMSQLLIGLYLNKKGMVIGDVTMVPLAAELQASALEGGAIDAVYAYEPLSAEFRSSGIGRELVDGVTVQIMNPMPIGAALMSKKFIDQRPKDANSIRDIFYQSVDYIRENPYNARTILQNELNLRIDYAWETTWLDTHKVDEIDFTNIDSFINLLVENGIIPEKPDFESMLYQ